MYNNPFFREQQPIQNIFTNQMPNSNFMARFLKEGETPQEIYVNTKTALISLSDKKLYIKEQDGTITTYDILIPLDEKDKKIKELENQINDLKEMMTNVSKNESNETTIEFTESSGNTKRNGRK